MAQARGVLFCIQPRQAAEEAAEKIVAAGEGAERVFRVAGVVLLVAAQPLAAALFELFIVAAEHHAVDQLGGGVFPLAQAAERGKQQPRAHGERVLAGAAGDDRAVDELRVLLDERLGQERAVGKAEQRVFDAGVTAAVKFGDVRHVFHGVREHVAGGVAERFGIGIAVAAVIVRHHRIPQLVQPPRELVVPRRVLVHAVGDLDDAARAFYLPLAHEDLFSVKCRKLHSTLPVIMGCYFFYCTLFFASCKGINENFCKSGYFAVPRHIL